MPSDRSEALRVERALLDLLARQPVAFHVSRVDGLPILEVDAPDRSIDDVVRVDLVDRVGASAERHEERQRRGDVGIAQMPPNPHVTTSLGSGAAPPLPYHRLNAQRALTTSRFARELTGAL